MGVKDINKIYNIDEMVKGHTIFIASAVTDAVTIMGGMRGVYKSDGLYNSASLIRNK
jgi:fructose-1,6-bisphosphatase/sedoheptulose 1,7-bisphosphatase-like protein